jgi:uncharacterized protein (DUF983 family)
VNPLWGWCVDRLSRVLEPGERAVVLGDFAELRVSGPRAVGELLGLIARRQAVLWQDWRPWVVLAAVTLPFGLLLSFAARRMADGSAIYLWQYTYNWAWSILDAPGPRRDLMQFSTRMLVQGASLICWAWTLGLLIGRSSWRTRHGHAALFCVLWLGGATLLALLIGELGGVPRIVAMAIWSPRDNPLNRETFTLGLFGVVFPLLVHVFLVLLPAFIGIRHGGQLVRRTRPVRTIVVIGAAVTLAALAIDVWSSPSFWLTLAAPMTYLLLAVYSRRSDRVHRIAGST